MKKVAFPTLIILSSALFLSIPWYSTYFIPFIFVSFVPLLHYEGNLNKHNTPKKVFFIVCFITFYLWNIAITNWMSVTSSIGSHVYYFENSFMMSLTMMLYHILSEKLSDEKKYNKKTNILLKSCSFIACWLSFELLQFNWDFSWPWFNLGNILGYVPFLAQWYEYTGVLGGSLWILLVNVLIFNLVTYKGSYLKASLLVLLGIFIPITISLLINYTYKDAGEEVEVVIVQPNIDPYEEKFPAGKHFIPHVKQLEILLDLAASKVTPQTEYVLCPETSYPARWDLSNINNLSGVFAIEKFQKKYPWVSLVLGMETHTIYGFEHSKSTATSVYNDKIGFFDFYNSAVQIHQSDVQIHQKSKRLHWVESIPYRKFFNFIEPLSIYLGSLGNHGVEKRITTFHNDHGYSIAPIICYESVYGNYNTEFINKGAQAIFIMTNDGWWKNTDGYKQHFTYDRLRAIENRRSIARSSNNGISGFIDQKGNVLLSSPYLKKEALIHKIKFNREKTVYSKLGDYIGWVSFLSLLFLVFLTLKNREFKIRLLKK